MLRLFAQYAYEAHAVCRYQVLCNKDPAHFIALSYGLPNIKRDLNDNTSDIEGFK